VASRGCNRPSSSGFGPTHTSITLARVSLSCPRNNPASSWSASLRRRESSLISDQLKRTGLSDRGIASATIGRRSPRSIGGQWILLRPYLAPVAEQIDSRVSTRCCLLLLPTPAIQISISGRPPGYQLDGPARRSLTRHGQSHLAAERGEARIVSELEKGGVEKEVNDAGIAVAPGSIEPLESGLRIVA
jgi:hypothetical protein